MKKIKLLILTIAIGVFAGLGLVAMPTSVMAADPTANVCAGNNTSPICQDQTNIGDIIKKLVNVLLFGVGVVSVFMIIFSGIRYTTSGGDAGNVKKAKDTLLYAIVGLVVSIMAYAIVNFVVGVLLAK